MWDLTIPGNNDHDFYVVLASSDTATVLVHNCGGVVPYAVEKDSLSY
jgi:hypothetical protein